MNKVYFFLLDILEFFGKIEMKIKHLLNRNLYKSLSENNIPPNTFYCYSGCRYNLNICPFMDYSIIAGSKYCLSFTLFSFSFEKTTWYFSTSICFFNIINC